MLYGVPSLAVERSGVTDVPKVESNDHIGGANGWKDAQIDAAHEFVVVDRVEAGVLSGGGVGSGEVAGLLLRDGSSVRGLG
jgi:hypothetical protein